MAECPEEAEANFLHLFPIQTDSTAASYFLINRCHVTFVLNISSYMSLCE